MSPVTSRTAASALLALLLACSSSTNTVVEGATCSSVCDRIAGMGLPCGGSSADCAAGCATQVGICNGDVPGYQSYLNCLQTATFTCNTGGLTDSCTLPSCVTNPDAGTPGSDGSAPSPDSPSGDSPSTGDSACAAQATIAACVQCCQTGHSAGASAFSQAVQSCECGSSGACQTACATEACGNPPMNPATGDACDTCVNASLAMNGACVTPVGNACSADPNCSAFLACGGGCNQSM